MCGQNAQSDPAFSPACTSQAGLGDKYPQTCSQTGRSGLTLGARPPVTAARLDMKEKHAKTR